MASPDDSETEIKAKALRGEIDDYLSSVRGIHAFAQSALWNEEKRQLRPDGRYSVPRSMSRRGDDPDVTPDLVVQVTPDYGVVAEMKKHVRDVGDRPFSQIEKYDADLSGWWTESGTIPKNDLVLLTHLLSSTIAKDAAEAWIASGKSFGRPFAIVEYSFTDGAQRWFVLRRVFGSLSDRTHDEKLRLGKPMPESVVEDIIARKRFYDADPPLIHMLIILENHVVPALFEEAIFDTAKGVPAQEVTVDEIWQRLQADYGNVPSDHREVRVPKRDWVVRALDQLVAFGLAKQLPKDRYALLLKRPNGKDWLTHFARAMLSKSQRAEKPQEDDHQGSLFGPNGPNPERP